MSPTVLRCCIDTLEVSLEGSLADGIAEELDRLKTLAQDFGTAQRFGESRLMVEDKAFGFWRWRLTCPDYSVVLANVRTEGNRVPDGQVRFSAFGLSTREHRELVAEAFEQLKLLGDYFERNVARLDVCVDVQGWMPDEAEMAGISCVAPFRAVYANGERAQTFQYGKGDVVVRLYDKTAEIAHSRKSWMPLVWRVCEGYEEGDQVTRVEAQVKTKALRELGITSVEHALTKAGDALDWALGQWCNLRVPNGDKKVTRWPEHPVWAKVRHALPTSEHLLRVRAKAKLMPVEDAAKRLVGLAALIGANYREDRFMECVAMLADLAEIRMNEDDVKFKDLVQDKRKRVEAETGWDAEVPF